MNSDVTRGGEGRPRFSRLRLRIAAVFTITFLTALTLVAVGSMGWLLRESKRRLDSRLTLEADGVARAVAMEKAGYPDSGLRAVVDDVQREWVAGPDTWIVVDSSGVRLAATTDSVSTRRVLAGWHSATRTDGRTDIQRDGDDMRVVSRAVRPADGLPAYTILSVGTTEGIESDAQLLRLALWIAAPLITLVSLVGGYVLARWALRPADTLGRAIDALGPAAPAARLPVVEPDDEIGQLARRFNALLDRLTASQLQNRDFVREAAHQIRTPLTLVRGEAEYARAAIAPNVATLQAALDRIERASRQMQRRVDELLLLAEAEAGAVLEQRTAVELDTLALEGVDLFRARAAQLGRPLAYGTLEPSIVMGDEALLREALLELLENACRHGSDGTAITVSVRATNGGVDLTVESRRPAADVIPLGTAAMGLGQRIVRWIAEVHDGRFAVVHDASERYAAVLSLPMAPAHSSHSL